MPKSLLIDVTKCVGCGECARACARVNHLPEEESNTLSATHYTVIKQIGDVYVRRLCMHCQSPTCVSVCPVGAITKTSIGSVIYDADKCLGCRYCLQACPFEVPRYEWGSLAPRMQKCIFCYGRISNGQITGCAEACQFQATNFGERDDMIKEARKRISESPNDYIDYIYGLQEVGGTSVLYISKVPFAELGLPMTVPKQAIPELSWMVLSQIPKYSIAAGAVLYGIHWITSRRQEVARFEAEERKRKDK